MTIRIVGLIVGLILIGIGFVGRRGNRFSRGDTLLWIAAGTAVSLLSVVPGAADTLSSLLLLENRLFAVLVASVAALFFLVLRQRSRLRSMERRFGDLVRNLAVRDFEHRSEIEGHSPAIAVVIAAFNEEDAIGGVLSDLPREIDGYRLDPIVVVDGGTDDTENVVQRAGYSVATHPVNRGQGDALRTGFAIAMARGDEIIVTMVRTMMRAQSYPAASTAATLPSLLSSSMNSTSSVRLCVRRT